MPETKDVEASGYSRPSSERRDRDKELIGLIPQAVIEIRFDGFLLFANWHSRKLFGFGLDEDLAGEKNVFDYIDTADQELIRTCMELILAGERVRFPEIRVVRRDGTTIPVLVYANLIANGDGAAGIRAVITEITEKKETERALKKLEKKYRDRSHLLPQAIFETDVAGRITYANRNILEMFRFTAEDICRGVTVFEGIPLKEYRRMAKIVHRVKTLTGAGSGEFDCLRKDGSVFPALITARAKVREGSCKGMWGIVTDITIPREMVKKINELEERCRLFFSSTGTAMIIVDDDMTISLANEEFYRFSGYLPGEKLTLSSLVLDKDEGFMEEIHRTKGVGEKTIPESYEFRHVRRDGGVRDGLLRAELIPGTRKTVASVADITDLKQTQKKLERQSESLKDANAALKVLLKRREQDKTDLERTVLENMKQSVFPLLEKLKLHKLSTEGANIIAVIEENLKAIMSPFLPNITTAYPELTPREIEIIILVKEGRSSKEISRILHTSERTIDYQRNSIRRKLGISKSKANLRTHIMTHLDIH